VSQQYCGNIVHAVLEDTISKDSSLDHNEMVSKFEEHTASYDPDQKISKELMSVGKEIIDEFYDKYSDFSFDVYEKEYGFSFIIGNYHIMGYIDRIDLYDDKVHIVDYKTGKWEVTQKDVGNNLQLGIYALAASLMFPDKEIYAELHYLRSGRKKGHTFSEEDLENVKNKIINNINLIIEDQNFTATNNSRICSWCEHAKTGACPTGVFRNKKAARA
jgi:CRISPR/Cas system-associated exonuclease Cas4 (RecB family)